jgi:hypothetical protein
MLRMGVRIDDNAVPAVLMDVRDDLLIERTIGRR